MSQFAWIAGMVGGVCTALLGQADLVGEPYKHYIAIAGIVATAISGYMIQRPPADAIPGGNRKSDPPAKE